MSLGEAFIEVRADLRPFSRDLRNQARPILEAFEEQLQGAVGRAINGQSGQEGEKAGGQLGKGIKKGLDSQLGEKSAFLSIAAALAGALDDGVSALPMEVKAALVGSIIAVSPLVGGALAAAVAAALGVAVVGIGVLLAAQFEEVQERAVEFGRSLRETLVRSAQDFVPAINNAFDMVEARFAKMGARLDEIFNVSSNFLEPLVQGGLDALEAIISSIFSSLDEIKPFVDELGAALGELGKAIGTALEILVDTGDEGRAAFRDLIALVSGLVIATAGLLYILAKVYGAFRTLVGFVADVFGWFNPLFKAIDGFFDTVDRRFNKNKSFVNTNTDLAESFESVIAKTEAETKALKDYSNALKHSSDVIKNQLELNISWEESLDKIAQALKENGKTLDIRTEKGRENAREFLEALQIAQDRTVALLQRGAITNQEAVRQYDEQIAALRRMATQAGISTTEFDKLFGEMIEVGRIRLSSEQMGIDSLASELGKALGQATKLERALLSLRNIGRSISSGALAGLQGFADGGFHFLPNIVRVAEDGPEVTIPLTKPARAAQLLQQSGLSSMLAGSGSPTFMVFIGNEQLDSRVVRIVETNNRSQAAALSYGGRNL